MDLKPISFNDKDELSAAIRRHENFSVSDIKGAQSVAVKWLKNEIESQGMRCRIFYGYRKAVLAGAVIPSAGITQAIAITTGLAMAIHNVATRNPDYEICKAVVGSGVEVTYRKV